MIFHSYRWYFVLILELSLFHIGSLAMTHAVHPKNKQQAFRLKNKQQEKLRQTKLKNRIRELMQKAQQRYQQTKAALSSRQVIGNIWFLRSLSMVGVVIISALLLVYSFIFESTYVTLGEDTSYFPWSYGTNYASTIPVLNLFVLGVGISLIFIAASSIALDSFISVFAKSIQKPTPWTLAFRRAVLR